MRVSDTQHASTAACITADCEKGRLFTQDRHEANGVSDVRSARKRACLCGMCCCELLLTCDHRLLGRDAQRRNASDLLSYARWQVNELSRRETLLQPQCVDGAARLLHCVGDVCQRLLASLPLLRRAQLVVGALRARDGRAHMNRGSYACFDALVVRSA